MNEAARAEAFASLADKSRELAAGHLQQAIQIIGSMRNLRDNVNLLLQQMKVEFRWSDTRLDLMGPNGEWVEGPDLRGLRGYTGPAIELRVEGSAIEYRPDDGSEDWTTLLDLGLWLAAADDKVDLARLWAEQEPGEDVDGEGTRSARHFASTAAVAAATAAGAADAAETAASDAISAAGSASAAANSAGIARDRAAEWAGKDEDDPVEAGEFSAKHYAAKAAAAAAEVDADNLLTKTGNLAGIADLDAARNNLGVTALLAAKADAVQIADQLRLFAIEIAEARGDRMNMMDGIADPFADLSDIDVGASSGFGHSTTAGRRQLANATSSPKLYNPAATPLASGNTTSNVVDNAFNSTTAHWEAAEGGEAANGVSWIGFDLGAGNAQPLASITLTAGSSVSTPASVLVQWSDDGTSWQTATTHSGLATSSGAINNLEIAGAGGSHRFWRVLANASVGSSNRWRVVYFRAKFAQLMVPISGGDASGYEVANLFGVNQPSSWRSLQTGAATAGAAWVGVDLGAGNEKAVSEITFANAGAGQQCVLQASSDMVNWLPVTTNGTINTGGNATSTLTVAPSMAVGKWRYWRLLCTSPASGVNPWALAAIRVTLADISTMSVRSVPFASDIVPAEIRLALQVRHFADPVSNGTLQCRVSRNGGVDWTPVLLAKMFDQADGAAIYDGIADVTAQGSGSDVIYRFEVPAPTVLHVMGVIMQWKETVG